MADKTLAEEIITIVENTANNNPAPEKVKIINTYNDGFVDIQNSKGDVQKYLQCIGEARTDTDAILAYLDGVNPVVIADTNTDEAIILSLGLGLFHQNDGDLYVEFPEGKTNIFSINNDGELLVNVTGENQYSINENDCFYERWDW